MSHNKQVLDNRNDILEAFRHQFQSVYTVPRQNHNLSENPNFMNLSTLQVEIGDIYKKITKLDIKKGPEPDNIPNKFIKHCHFSLARPLWLIFNRSLQTGCMPTQWKQSLVIPIYKSGNKKDINNYRPISIMNSFAMIFESLVTAQLTNALQIYIAPEQHGFTKGKSTQSNLMLYENYIVKSLDERIQVDAVYTDFSKAFDKVNHRRLLAKLHSCGIRGYVYDWLESYLANRKQFVKIENHF